MTFPTIDATPEKKKSNSTKINDDVLLNRMSLFLAYPTPMMNLVTQTTTDMIMETPSTSANSSVSRDQVTTFLAAMANVCQEMIANKVIQNPQTQMFCLRAMTAAIVLYDHINAAGAFQRKSPIDVKSCIISLKNFNCNASESLLNALRYTTVHLNDPTTPASIKSLLD